MIQRNEYDAELPSEPPVDAHYGEPEPQQLADHRRDDEADFAPPEPAPRKKPDHRTDMERVMGLQEVELNEDMEAEQMVLGTIMATNEAFHHIGLLKEYHFFYRQHQRLFSIISGLMLQGDAVTPITVRHHLTEQDREKLPDKYLANLVAISTQSFNNIRASADIVMEMANRRRLRWACSQVVAMRESDASEISKILAEAIEDVTQGQNAKRMRDGRAVTTSLIERLSKPIERTSTGLMRLDTALGGGLRRGQAYGFMAEYGNGKTMIAGTISQNLDKDKKRHLFIAAEMGDEEIHARSLARDLGISYNELESEDLDPRVLSEAAYIGLRHESSVIYQSQPFLTFDMLKQIVASAVATKNIEGVILDYWQLVRGWKAGNKTEHLDEVADWIAAAAKSYNIWFVVLGQLNRDGNVRGGDGALMAFGNLFFIQRPDKTQPYAWLEAKKVRHTRFMNVGSENSPALEIVNGTHFKELDEAYSPSLENAVAATEKKGVDFRKAAEKKRGKKAETVTGKGQATLLPEKEGE